MNESDAEILYKTKINWTEAYSNNKIYCTEQNCDFYTKIKNDDELTNHMITAHSYGEYPCTHPSCNFVGISKVIVLFHCQVWNRNFRKISIFMRECTQCILGNRFGTNVRHPIVCPALQRRTNLSVIWRSTTTIFSNVSTVRFVMFNSINIPIIWERILVSWILNVINVIKLVFGRVYSKRYKIRPW